MAKKKAAKPVPQRSIQWFGRQDIYGFIYRSWVKNRGVPQDQVRDKRTKDNSEDAPE